MKSRNNTLDNTCNNNNKVVDICVRVYQSKKLFAVETQTGKWYVIDRRKNKYNGRYYDTLPFQCGTIMLIPIYMINLIFPRLKDYLVLTPWLLTPDQQ